MTTTANRNGVDVARLVQTIEAINGQPSLALFQFRSHTTWESGGRSKTTFQGFFGAGQEDTSRTQPLTLIGDEPPVLLGDNIGPNAVEAVLHALASCLSVGFIYNAAAKGIEMRALEFELEGDLDLRAFLGLSADVPPGYNGIRVRYRVDADASPEELADLCNYVQRTSPVMDIITRPVPVTVERIS